MVVYGTFEPLKEAIQLEPVLRIEGEFPMLSGDDML
jgi:hypothetical protein